MEKKDVLESLSEVRKNSKKRNFNQSIDLIITLKDLDVKKTDNQRDLFVILPHPPSKSVKVCALVGPESVESAKDCHKVISQDEFPQYEADENKIKKLAKEYDFFVAQANIMPLIAKVFGKVLGRRGKMPNPKAGCIVPPKTNLKALVEKLQKTVEVKIKNAPMVQCKVGTEEMKDEEIAENIIVVFNNLLHALPNERNNIKSVIVKTTMGKPVKIQGW
ncbi:MAG: 50S ribosomal protein L1 [Candidatus Woesearchaeota archaeon]